MEPQTTTGLLLRTILQAALLGEPYPGQAEGTTFFPDSELVVGQAEIVLLDRFLNQDYDPEISDYEFSILSEEQLNARPAGDSFLYFLLTEAEIGPDEAFLSLELRWREAETENDQVGIHLGGGGVRVRFEKVAGEWQAPGGPIATWIS